MANVIYLSPDELLAAAAKQQTLSDQLERDAGGLSRIESQVRRFWSGTGASTAEEMLRSIRREAKVTANLISDNARLLSRVVRAFEMIESGAPSSAGRIELPEYRFNISRAEMPQIRGNLRIDPMQIRDASYQCRRAASSVQEIGAVFSQQTRSLSGAWEGRAFRKYMERCDRISRRLIQLASEMEDLGHMLYQLAMRYEDMDQRIARTMTK